MKLTPKGRGLGWRPQKPDHRDSLFAYVPDPKIAKALPPKAELAEYPIFDQGQLGSCFQGNTKIALLNGTSKTIKELAEIGSGFWVYASERSGRIVPALATASKTGINRNLVEVELDNGEKIICTPDHKFRLRLGNYVCAASLKSGQSLMPLYRRVVRGYEELFENATGRWVKTHRYIKECVEQQIPTQVVHHKDHNPRNNDPDTALRVFGNVETLREACKNYNCKVVSVTALKQKEDVYCLTVPGYHNFALESGVFVHNCTGNGISFCVLFDSVRQGLLNPVDVPSRLMIYWLERSMEGTVDYDAGAVIRDGIKAIANWGTCLESGPDSWPYDVSKFTLRPPQDCFNAGLKFRAVQYKPLQQTSMQFHACIAEGFPFVFGFTCYPDLDSDVVAQTGMLPMPDINAAPIGGHCVVCVGYDDTTRMYKIRNSWGNNWGQNGYFFMPFDYLHRADLASDFWTVRVIG